MYGSKDVIIKGDSPKKLVLDKHIKYLRHYAEDDSGPEQIMAEHLKINGMYWGLNALFMMNAINENSPEIIDILKFLKQCQRDDGGFGASIDHDSNLVNCLSAVQLLVIFRKCNQEYIDIERCVDYIQRLQQPDGSFYGDRWGEIDTRFSFCALATLKLLNRLDAIDLNKAVEFVMSCNNQIDGGFGRMPGSESHSAYVYCCLGSLAIADKLDLVDKDMLGWWLSERQLPSGGLNGRPEKLPDLCYSWWCLSSMKMIDQMHRIDYKKLVSFILACQDDENGGFSDRPGNWVDVYHTMFAIASLSLICQHHKSTQKDKDSSECDEFQDIIKKLGETLMPVNPTLCMPIETLIGYSDR